MIKGRTIFIYEAPGNPLYDASLLALERGGYRLVDEPGKAMVAIAPMLRTRLEARQYNAPCHGTLIFHPSLLPRRRGPDAVRWALYAGDAFTGVTWFWCADGLDAGAICEQELVAIPPAIAPGVFYREHLVPAGARALERALAALSRGVARRVPQDEDAATYQSWLRRPASYPLLSWAGLGGRADEAA